MSRRLILTTVLGALVLVTLPAVAEASGCGAQCQEDMARAREATHRYRDVNAALGDGFTETGGCARSDVGVEGMTYFNVGRFDTTVDVTQPEGLIYIPEGLGFVHRRLVAVEYSAMVVQDGLLPYLGHEAPSPGRINPPPVLFGRTFEGPLADGPGGMWRYRLRVWLWSANPNGTFAVANPAEACGAADMGGPGIEYGDCHEVNAVVAGDPAAVRRATALPPSYELSLRADGQAQVLVAAFDCGAVSIAGRDAGALKFFAMTTLLESPFGYRGDPCCSRYLWKLATDSPDLAKAWRVGTNIPADDVAHDPNLRIELDPVAGSTDLEYVVDVPVFGLQMEAVTTERLPAALPASVHVFRAVAQGTVHFAFRLDELLLSPAAVTIDAQPTSPLHALSGDRATLYGFTVTWDLAVGRRQIVPD